MTTNQQRRRLSSITISTPNELSCKDLVFKTLIDNPGEVFRLKNRAFTANKLAKASIGAARAAHYREKDDAINCLLKIGHAFIDGVDWFHDDPLFGLWFTGGGKLHIKLSCLDRDGLDVVRALLNGVSENAA